MVQSSAPTQKGKGAINMKRYRLCLDGISYLDNEGVHLYKLTQSRNAKAAAETYGRSATITDMKGKVLSRYIYDDRNGTGYYAAKEEVLS